MVVRGVFSRLGCAWHIYGLLGLVPELGRAVGGNKDMRGGFEAELKGLVSRLTCMHPSVSPFGVFTSKQPRERRYWRQLHLSTAPEFITAKNVLF